MDDLSVYLPKLLPIAGMALQFAMRQFKGVNDGWYHVVAVGLTAACYLLTMELSPSWRLEIVRFLVWIPENLPLVWGGTFLMSNMARAGSTSLPATMAKAMPVTDSR